MKELYENPYEPNEFLTDDYEDVFSQLRQLDKQIHKLKRKKKGKKQGKKRKIKKRLRALEREYQQLKQFTIFLSYHCKAQPKQIWWQEAICTTLPKAFELATATMNKLPTKAETLYLPDNRNDK